MHSKKCRKGRIKSNLKKLKDEEEAEKTPKD